MNEFADGARLAERVPPSLRLADCSEGCANGGVHPMYRAYRIDDIDTRAVAGQPHAALTNLLEEIDPETKQQMIVQHLRMVVSIAKHYTNRGLDMVELVRVGNQGLLHAMERFEPEGGFCFSTFLTWCVTRQIELAILRRNRDGGAGNDAMRSMTFEPGRLA